MAPMRQTGAGHGRLGRDFAELPIRDEVRPLILRDNAAALLGRSA